MSTSIFSRFLDKSLGTRERKGGQAKKFLKVKCNKEQKEGVNEIVSAVGGGRPIIIFGYLFIHLFINVLTY